MLYELNLNQTILDVLENRMSSIADIIITLEEQGYNPSKNKLIVLNISKLLFDAYDNIELFSNKQTNNINNVYNFLIKL